MSDKLAVIQTQETLEELGKLETGVTKLIESFTKLNTAVDQTNTKLNRGTPKETIEGIKDLDGYSKEYMRTLKDMATIEQKTQQIRLTNARITTEQVRAAKELANQQNAEARAKKQVLSLQEKQKKILSESIDPYKKFTKQELDAKNKAKDLAALMELLEQDFKNGKIGVSAYEKQLSKLSKEFTEAKLKAIGLDSALKKIDKSVGDNQRNVGNYQSALNGMGSGFGGMMSRAETQRRELCDERSLPNRGRSGLPKGVSFKCRRKIRIGTYQPYGLLHQVQRGSEKHQFGGRKSQRSI